MRFIGITGGVGAGKSAILSYLAQKPKTKVLLADEIAHDLMEPGTDCYREIVKTFAGEDIFQDMDTFRTAEGVSLVGEELPFHRGKLAQVIFSDETKREQMNAIVHPAVKDYVSAVFNEENKKRQLDYLILDLLKKGTLQ